MTIADNNLKKPRVIFVGSFAPSAKDGTVGGQMFACKSLVNSPLSDVVEWHFIDSTQKSQPPPNMLIRAVDAFRRICTLLWLLLFKQVDCLFIFSAYELTSLMEKGLMCIFGRVLHKRVVLTLRSEIKTFSYDRWLMPYKRLIINSCDTIICQSESAALALSQIVNPSRPRIVIIRNWIDAEKYKSMKTQTAPGKPVTFLYLGWLESYKGVHELIDAARILKERGHSFTLLVCGNGSLLNSLKSRAAEWQLDEHVEFPGWVTGDALLSQISRSDVFVLPSYSEGLPNALLESMSAGLAVIVTPVGGIPDVIKDGDNGLIVPVGDAVALATKMEQLIAEPETILRMGKLNVRKIARDHDIHKSWRAVAEVIIPSAFSENKQAIQ